ncbi:meckelin-like isoform X1, partial [Clarias magur]
MQASGFQQKKKNAGKKKQQVYGGDIVFSKQGNFQTIPSLAKRLKAVTDPVIGLQYIWEYRSPSKSVPPHYQCRLCKVQWLQNEMAAHVSGWKHCFKYLKHAHAEKIPHEEEQVGKNPAIKKEMRAAAAEVEQAEGRGQIKVVNREPADMPVFQNMKSAFPTAVGPGPSSLLGAIPGGFYPCRPMGGAFLDPPFEEEFQPQGGMMSDFHGGPGDAQIRSPEHYGPDRMMGSPESMQLLSNSRSMPMGSDSFGMGLQNEDMDRPYSDDLPVNSSRMRSSQGQDSNSTLSTLLRCLDTFRIECEDDAQIVLKITQKLTDVLMEYRLRTISSGPSMNSSRLPLNSDRFTSSMSGLNCECQPGFKVLNNNGGYITCQKCTDLKPGVTQDGYDCIRCPGGLGGDGKCQCPAGNVLVERSVNGILLQEAQCELCNGTDPAFSSPDMKGNRCVRCQESFINTSQSCACGSNIPAGGMCFPPNSLPSSVVSTISFTQLGLAVPSAWFTSFLYSSAAACLLFTNRTACQALGNMCVLNMHSSSTMSNDACGLYNTIYRATSAQGNNQDNPYWRLNLPWLYYGEQPGLASRVLQSEPLPVGFNFKGTDKSTNIQLLAAVYTAQGEFVRWENIGRRNLQLCPDTLTRLQAAYTFGTAYKQTCVLSVSDLLAAYSEPLFYDVFMVQQNTAGDKRLLAVPILNLALQLNGQFVNQASNMNSWYLTRRLMIIDTLSGREKSLMSTPRAIRVANNLQIRFHLVPNTQKGQVYPPLMTVSYSDILITDPAKQTVAVSFSLDYEMDQSDAQVKTD